MSEKEYIVSLNRGVDYKAFNQEMIASTGAGDIPNRAVDVANARPGSQRNTHYMLTDAEVETLRNDSRVYGVTLKDDPDISIGRTAVQTGDFSKTTLDRGDFLNWGMRRMNEATNPYDGETVEGGYNYTLDGTGVDVVIQDSGIQADHPEFQDADGVSRVQQIDWYAESGLSGTMPAGHYTDYDGHGTHVAGTAVGKTYGWAKNARIYSIKVDGLEGPTDPNGGIPIADCFDVIKEWHNNKPIDPATGVKRPTVVNMSWGYSGNRGNPISGTYRGTPWTAGTAGYTTANEIWEATGIVPPLGLFRVVPARVDNVDVDVQELIDAGIHVCVAAGNNYYKADVAGGDDYDNTVNFGFGSQVYHRGSSPYDDEAHIVGNIDSTLNEGGLEQKANSSTTGPGVSVYAPGTDIMSAMSTINKFNANTVNNPYPADAAFLINNISGTSMASPQVAGMLALWLQLNPEATPAQALAFVNTSAKSAQIYQTGSAVDYTDTRSLLGGNNRFAFNKFNSNVQLRIGSPAPNVDQQVAQQSATYALSSSAASVNEGSAFIITLTTTNVDDGTAIPYTITGVTSADIDGSNLTGNFVVSNNTAQVTFNVTADTTTEGSETFVLTLDSLSTSQSVIINDTSTTPVAPTYAVAPAANNVDEGSTLTFNVTTSNVPDATTLYWTVTSPSDWNVDSGSFVISSNAGSFTVTPAADALTEGAENFTVNIRTGSIAGTVVATSSSITINDISTTPSGTVYNVTVASGTNQYGTGNKYYIDGFTGASPTVNLTEGQTYVFRQSDSSNATHPLRFSTTDNGTHGGGTEYTTGVVTVGTAGQLGAYTEITVAIGAPTLYYYCINHSGMGGTANTPSAGTPTYDSLTSSATANEGDTVVFTLSTQNIEDGTTVGYTISGIDAGDLSAGSLTGSITINSNSGTASVTLDNDLTTEGSETMTMTLDATDSAGDSTNELTSQTVISDTSIEPVATFALSATSTAISEGDTVTVTLTTTLLDNGSTVGYTVSGIDESDLSQGNTAGDFVISNNTASIQFTLAEDQTTEGLENMTVSLANGQDSITISVEDTSLDPSADYILNVGNSGASHYLFNGNDRSNSFNNTQDPTLNFNVGDIVDFVVAAPGHPFHLKTVNSTGTGNQADGVVNNGAQNDTVRWIIPVGYAGQTLHYNCQFHGSMHGTITVS